MPVRRGLAIGGMGGVGLLAVVVIAMLFGVDPSQLLEQGDVGLPPSASVQGPPLSSETADEQAQFVSVVLADTEDTWREIFARAGRRYEEPRLVLFSGATQSACGFGQAAMGPFYCPADRSVYIDLSFYDELHRRFQAPGDFAEAYVIAHEIGHHVQNLLGISDRVASLQHAAEQREANALSVAIELQADCLAGIWAHYADRSRGVVEPGDLEEALAAAAAVGDDRIQRRTQGTVVPDSFTHGTSAQRVEWFRRGLTTGNVDSCDTFAGLGR